MLQQINSFLGKWMPLLTPLSVLIGVLASVYLHPFSFIVPWIFAFMTFSGSLSSSFKSFQHTLTHPMPIFLTLSILHIIIPLWAWGIGTWFFSNDPLIVTGLILAVSIPTGITSVIWVTMYNGNIPLALSIILIDTIISPLVVPFSMSLFVGKTVEMNSWDLMQGLLVMVVIPSILGMIINQFGKQTVVTKLRTNLAPFSKIGLPFVIAINSSAVAPYLTNINFEFLQIMVTMLFIAICGYLFTWLLGIVTKRKRDEIISLVFTGGMRNISAGAVLAVSFFPPKAAVPVIVCMLFQQLLAASQGQLMSIFYRKKDGMKSVQVGK